MKMIKMTNRTKKVLSADIMPLGSGITKVNPGDSVIVGPDSRKYLGFYMIMVRKGFTMTAVDNTQLSVPKITDPIVPDKPDKIEESVTDKVVDSEPLVKDEEQSQAEDTPDKEQEVAEAKEQPKAKRSRKKSSPEVTEESGDINE